MASQTGDIVMYAMSTILPIITVDHLGLPRLCKHFFSLVQEVMSSYSDRVAQLEPAPFAGLVDMIQFGVQHAEPDIAKESMRALFELVDWHRSNIQEGGAAGNDDGPPGLLRHMAQQPDLFLRFMQLIVDTILYRKFDRGLTEQYSNTLFVLVCVDGDSYNTVIGQLIEQQGPDNQQRLAHAFEQLTAGVEQNPGVRRHRQLFRKNLDALVLDVRGFISQR